MSMLKKAYSIFKKNQDGIHLEIVKKFSSNSRHCSVFQELASKMEKVEKLLSETTTA
jgi:hypothetical protein